VILSPVLPSRGSEAAADVPAGPQPVLYTVQPGDTLGGIASSQGISLARLFALNAKLTPLSDTNGESLVVGLR
jgi:LysM repeat protein